MDALLRGRAAKPLLLLLCLLPFAWLLAGALTDGLGPNPAERLIRSTGDWALRMLCIALAVTLRVLTGVAALARLRRMLGLFAYFYVVLHLLCYVWLDMDSPGMMSRATSLSVPSFWRGSAPSCC